VLSFAEVMPAGVQAAESNVGSPSKTFIVWIVLEKPHRYLYDRLWKNLNPGGVLFFRHVDQADKRDAVFHGVFVAAKELQVKCSITVVET
jgi:hypothetical protein